MAKRILILEDDIDAADTLKILLSVKGFIVDLAYDGRQGVTKLRANKPDLMVTDLSMPIMDGWAVLVAVRRDPNYANMPIAILTSSKEPQNIEKARKFGVNAYWLKPYDAAKVVRGIQHLLEPQSDPSEKESFSGLMEGDMIEKGGL